MIPIFHRHHLLRRALGNNFEERLGDLDEYTDGLRQERGAWPAQRWRLTQTSRILLKAWILHLERTSTMFLSTFKTALRNIQRHKAYSAINMLGLTLGIACSLLALLWFSHEAGFDRFHEHRASLYQVYFRMDQTHESRVVTQSSYYPLAETILAEVPEVQESVRYHEVAGMQLQVEDRRLGQARFAFADAAFLDVFTFPLVEGDPAQAFDDPLALILTQPTARRLFGEAEALGQRVNVNGQADLLVTGVLADIPQQSSLQFDALLPFALQFPPHFTVPTHWGGNPLQTWVRLHDSADPAQVEAKITQVIRSRHAVENTIETYFLHPLSRLHLHKPGGGGLIQTLRLFALCAGFVLLIACFNFVNLATARATTRAKEVGLRKVVGAQKGDLIRQFLGESLILALLAMVLAWGLCTLVLPQFNGLAGQRLPLSAFTDIRVMGGLLLVALAAGLLSALYPAWILSRFRPASVLRAAAPGRSGSVLRRLLVLFQFALSVVFILSTLTLSRLMDFVKTKDLGFNQTDLYLAPLTPETSKQFAAIKHALLQLPQVEQVSKGLQNPANIGSTVHAVTWPGKAADETIDFNWDVVDFDYIETLGFELAEGRSFSNAYATDAGGAFVLNQEAARVMGLTDPVGTSINVWGNDGTIIGVLKDFHFQPLRQEIRPFIYWINTDWPDLLFIRLKPGAGTEAEKAVATVLNQYQADPPVGLHPFENVLMGTNYATERRMGRVAQVLSGLAVLIASLGMLGLATFSTRRRVKEIGVRKVLGASSTQVVGLLVGDFTRWVLLANLAAWPAGFWIITGMLSRYAYRPDIGVEVYGLASLMALAVAWTTIGLETWRAASVNPARTLRQE